MDTSSKILILTAQYGNGHFQVAKTIQEAFQRRGFQHVTVCDLFEESHPRLTHITRYLYLKSYTFGKRIYRIFYYGADRMSDKKIASLYSTIGRNRLMSIIEQEKPDVIINTFPIAAVPELRKQADYSFHTYNILTDFCLHKMWIHSEIDTYFVATPELKELLGEAGVERNRIEVTGIPIRTHFELSINKSDIYQKYKLSPSKKTLLIVAGAHGVLTNVVQLCETFCSYKELQIIVVCGNNESLQTDLAEVCRKYPHNLKVFGYVERIDELFRISDCLITKPGGITLTEAAALQVPVILYKPVPGQESENAVFFQGKGAAIVVHEPEDVLKETIALLKDDQRLLQMKKAMLSIYESDSANKIVSSVEDNMLVEELSLR